MENRPPLCVGIGGPVGSGKTVLVDALRKSMRETGGSAIREFVAHAGLLE